MYFQIQTAYQIFLTHYNVGIPLILSDWFSLVVNTLLNFYAVIERVFVFTQFGNGVR